MTSRVGMASLTRTARRSVELGLLVLALAVFAVVLLARGVPATGRGAFVVGGGSMEPAIALGSAVITERALSTGLAVGDIVSMRVGPQQAVFTHRIVRIVQRGDGLWLETKGDANPQADPSLVPAAAVIGRVTIAIPFAGYLITALSTPSGAGMILGLAGLLLALTLLLDGDDEAASVRSGRRGATGASEAPGPGSGDHATVPA